MNGYETVTEAAASMRAAFKAMQETLRAAPRPPFQSGYKKAMLNYALACATWHARLENVMARAALALADRVKS